MRLAWSLTMITLLAATGIAHAAVITVTTPAGGAAVSGVIEVRGTIALKPGERVTPLVVQTMDGRRFPLFPDGDAGFVGTVDTSKLPNGHQTLLVYATPTARDARREGYADESWAADRMASQTEVQVLVRNAYLRCWGDIHAHTSYSDGAWYPEEAYRFARDTAKLDFFAVTDHEWVTTESEFADIKAQADSFDEPGRFVALWGVERTNGSTGHMCYYMTDTNQMPNGLDDFYRAIGAGGILGHFNHPWPNKAGQSWRNDFQGFRYAPEADRSMAMVELRNREEEDCYIAMLNNGWHVGAAGDEDKHDATWGQGKTWTVALARERTRPAILEALWARRTYTAADRNLMLDFTLDGEDMGAQVSRPVGSYEFAVMASDPDADDRIEKIDLFLDGHIAKTSTAPAGESIGQWSDKLKLGNGRHYCFVRVTQTGGKVSWSSPVWLTAYTSAPTAPKE